jgi:hypothetical protein
MSRAYIVSSGKKPVHAEPGWVTKISIGTEAIEAAVKMAIQYFTELPIPEPQRVNMCPTASDPRVFPW